MGSGNKTALLRLAGGPSFEAWMLSDEAGVDLKKVEREGVSKQPGRIEVVLVRNRETHIRLLSGMGGRGETAHCILR